MTLLDRKEAPAVPADPPGPSRTPAWLRDLALGVRFAAAGGREGWTRTLLTAVGVGLGVTLLFLAASVPHALDARNARDQARSETKVSENPDAQAKKSDSTVLRISSDTEYHDRSITGYLMRADGDHPVLPPGIDAMPAAGEMVVSPALKALLDSPDNALLKERYPYKVTGTITDEGLRSPGELWFYAGSDTLTTAAGGHRVTGYGDPGPNPPLAPLLIVLVIVVCVVLLAPVAIFIATAVRFGGDRRDRRLAALRLVGTDIRSTRRIAAGEALFGSVLGLLIGLALFLTGRQFVGYVEIWDVSAFPADLAPDPRLCLLVALAVPLTAVLVTLTAMRSVVIEPLGVVRNSRARKRRLWWRLLFPLAGLGVFGLTGKAGEYEVVNPYAIAGGAVLVLVGLALLLPWLVEACVNRLRGGPVPWQLATRRLQLSSGAASRAVSGVTVAVAGAVAVQMLFAAMNADFNKVTGQDTTRAQFYASSEQVSGDAAVRTIKEFRATEGVTQVIGMVEAYATKPGKYAEDDIQPTTSFSVGDCATLREVARIGSCEDGDTFVVHPRGDKEMAGWVDETARKGKVVQFDAGSGASLRWTLPADARTVLSRKDPVGEDRWGIMVTPGAIDATTLPGASTVSQIRIDDSVPDAAEHVRNTAARIDPGMRLVTMTSVERDRQYASIQTGLQVGATATLLLIAASMLVSQLEQLRERKRLLSVLVAFGTRRATLGWSVLWQTAVPVVLGLAVAVAGGLALGATLCWMVRKEVSDWWLFLPLAGAGAALILLVTLLSLPPLWRMMRPDGLRSE
ncbi:ABC transporter permease [Streptomyces sp. NE06-03E]|uniref:ABC transporter permease n=1 Tax=Streptomyces silvae TaxID=2803812 RepID=A0ABU8A865_9ACTN|nr:MULTISPECIES: FtsX-like permease family protein [unclassified Streptomyces]WSS63964.1 ABC transporter permease [Streptomyces sp. NBC_01177]WSS70958.1 ABC transporter permease [Streptomyces sp. NBC_01175]WSS77974.1 ABC transporter permease [Streptomyces sp. NBC_01174]MDX3054199.1 ABC transporter permease [Streptomyces sp. NE06-03E]MDX3325108.1 ABC transporter permease [Streptomyces sp. ME02-6979-3A]